MTLGQRIAQKRKELVLSQEGLGEQLGVEEDGPETVSPDQETLVEEVLSRYQAARPEPHKSVWDQWSVRILFALCGIMLALLVGVNTKVKEMDRRYDALHSSIYDVQNSVNNQIYSITRRVEESLKEQANLTAEWSAELVSTDPRANTATFQVRAVPKAYTEGMTAVFMMYSGGETVEAPARSGTGHSFSGEVTCPLSDQISLSVVFLSGGTGETQLLADFGDYYNYLYTESFPELTVSCVWRTGSDRNILLPTGRDTAAIVEDANHEAWTPAPPASIRVGLFRDQKLVLWYEPGVRYLDAVDREVPGWNLPEQVKLEPDHEYCVAALYTDEYGRRRVYPGAFTRYNSSPDSASAAVMAPGWGEDPDGWEF